MPKNVSHKCDTGTAARDRGGSIPATSAGAEPPPVVPPPFSGVGTRAFFVPSFRSSPLVPCAGRRSALSLVRPLPPPQAVAASGAPGRSTPGGQLQRRFASRPSSPLLLGAGELFLLLPRGKTSIEVVVTVPRGDTFCAALVSLCGARARWGVAAVGRNHRAPRR